MSSRQLLKVTVLTVFVLMAISSYIPDVVITFIFDGNEKMVSDEMYLGYPFHIAAIGSLLWVILVILGIIFWDRSRVLLQVYSLFSIAYHMAFVYYTRAYILNPSLHLLQLAAFVAWTIIHLSIPVTVFFRQLSNAKTMSKNQ